MHTSWVISSGLGGQNSLFILPDTVLLFVSLSFSVATFKLIDVVLGDETRRADFGNEWTVRIFEQMGKDINYMSYCELCFANWLF